MPKLKKLFLGLPILALALSVATVTVYAHEGHDHKVQNSDSTVSSDGRQGHDGNSGSDERTSDDKTRTRSGIDREARLNEDRLRKSGDDMLLRLQAERKGPRTAEQRKKNCEVRKTGLQRKVDNLNSNAAKHQKRIDDIFARVVAYQKEHTIVIDNFSALVDAATAAQSRSQASAQALAALKPSIDCNRDSVASDVAAFKAAAAQARTDLSAYKQAVKNILKAAQASKEQGV